MSNAIQSKINKKEKIIESLINNTDVLEMQFESYRLKVSAFGYNVSLNDYRLEAFVEIISTDSQKLDNDYRVKITLYNDKGNIVGSNGYSIYGSEFNGLQTCEYNFYEDGIALMVKKIRIFIVKEM